MRDYLPETVDSHGFVKIRPTLQLDAADVSPKKFSEKLDRIYSIGDVRHSVDKFFGTGDRTDGSRVDFFRLRLQVSSKLATRDGTKQESRSRTSCRTSNQSTLATDSRKRTSS